MLISYTAGMGLGGYATSSVHRARAIKEHFAKPLKLGLEDSSKISLLGLSELLAHDAVYLDLVIHSRWTLRFSKKKSSPNFLDLMINNVEDEPKETNKKDSGTCNNHGKEHYTEAARKLCRLIEEEDVKDQSRWERKNTFHSECFEEIFMEFGSTSLIYLVNFIWKNYFDSRKSL
ncbi:hypothetical protein POTOM_045647 [Populus tomentosa]|uniref:Uncharacterized protein n=1 Tax=Populus tomentosa TaxID=118781 RepID=A0A8X8CDD2_POPTO|nr:hypothetical protein POTOM_045647 [Populus tomentosa]